MTSPLPPLIAPLAAASARLIMSFALLTGAPARANSPASEEKETHAYCASIAASAELARLERQRKQLAELEQQLAARLAALESKQSTLRIMVDRLEAFERKSDESLIGVYSRMKPEAAAAQLAQLDDDMAAALMMMLKTKVSSAILGEMDAARGAALARRIAELRAPKEGRRP
ncbi:MAG: hypothetical protein CTY15_10755 [Methylocystis sp.]|nr:MAG: hypothetical protein CTY15_10755 [Methylocystis sp.]